MSYILDALQKSETERQSQIAPETYRLSRPVETDPSSAMRWLLLLCLLTLTVAGLSLLWQMWSPRNAATEANNVTHVSTAPQTAPAKAAEKLPESKPEPNIATATKTMQAAPAPKSLAPARSTDTESDVVSSPAASPQPASTEAAPQPVLEPAVAAPRKSEPRQAAAIAEPSVVPLPEKPSETPSEKLSETRATQAKMPVAQLAEPTLADAQPPQQTQVVTMAELPAGIRSSMPSLSFSFHVYASDPARRTIIINGRRLREGQTLNKEIRLINITPEGVVVAYRQHHIALPVINQW